MTGEEFLQKLRAELVLSVSDSVLEEQLRYYYGYIQEEVRKGRSESEVVAELGDPRLIARSVMDAAEAGGDQVAVENPFRYTESEINFNTDEEDLAYTGAQEDSDRVEPDPFRSFRQSTERDTRYQEQETAHDGQTVETDSRGTRESRFRGMGTQVFQTGGAGCLLTGIVLFFLLYLLATILGGIFAVLSPVLMPMLVVGVLLWLFYGIMKGQ